MAKVTNATKKSTKSSPPATTSATGCPSQPATPENSSTLTPKAAALGSVFKATNGIGTYKVLKAASSATDNIEVAYAPDGKTFVTLPAMPFSKFETLVDPTAVPPTAAPGDVTVTPKEASAGSVFSAVNGIGLYKVIKTAASASDSIEVSYAPDSKTYVTLPAMPFSEFEKLVKTPAVQPPPPTPVKSPVKSVKSITPKMAAEGSVFPAVNGIGSYRVIKSAAKTSDDVEVSYAPDGKTYVPLPPMPFAKFAALAKAAAP